MADTPAPFALANAEIDWPSDHEPFSSRYGDRYASLGGALAESQLVFLDANRLTERWQQLGAGDCFTLGETGFGTGSNFLLAWDLWQKVAPAAARLHYLAVEAHPLRLDDLARALAQHPSLAQLSDQLIAVYPAAIPGIHRLELRTARSLVDQPQVRQAPCHLVTLDLLFGDAEAMLAQLCVHHGFAVDGWFLDGFAPSRNPGMWNRALYRQLARLSRPGTTFGTYTVAGEVRRGLAEVGFEVQRVPGFGSKRERLLGQFMAATTAIDEPGPSWSWLPNAAPPITVAVIGAGIAGSSTALALAKRGIRVQLFDSQSGAGMATSGNPQAILYSKLSAHATPQSRFALHAYLYALRYYQALDQSRTAGQPELLHACGLLQLASTAQSRQRLLDIARNSGLPEALARWVEADEASQIAGLPIQCGGLHFPTGGWITPTALCRRLSDHPLITTHFSTAVAQLSHDPDSASWQLLDSQGNSLLQASTVVIANGAASTRFEPAAQLPIKPIGGQVSQLRASTGSQPLKVVLCGEGYIAPMHEGAHTFGASYRLHEDSGELSMVDHQHNLAMLQREFPSLYQRLDGAETDLAQIAGRYGVRATTPDRLPLAGPLADTAAFNSDYQRLRHDAKASFQQPGRYLPGLYIHAGHGSKGFIQAPLCAELIAALVTGGTLPIEGELMAALNPARFAIRALSRRQQS